MDQIVFLGMGETGFNIVETVASRVVSRKVRINGGARICCAKVYGEGQDLPENIGNALCCFGKSVSSALDTLEESSEMAVAVMIADLSELDVTLCTDTVVRIKEYFGENGCTK